MQLLKRSVFEAVGGFSGKQHIGDYELWHHIGAKYPVVVMSAGPASGAHMMTNRAKTIVPNPLVPFKYLNLSIVLFESEGFNPLDNQRRENILDELLRKQARGILYSLKKNGIRDTFRLKKASNLTWWQIILNAFKDQ